MTKREPATDLERRALDALWLFMDRAKWGEEPTQEEWFIANGVIWGDEYEAQMRASMDASASGL